MKYVILTRDGKVHRLTVDEPSASDMAMDKFFKRKINRYLSIDIVTVFGYNEEVKKDTTQQELF